MSKREDEQQDGVDVLLQQLFIGGIYRPRSPNEQPMLEVSHWQIWEIAGSRHLVGFNRGDRDGRVSSTIQSFDRERMTLTTASGRVYHLIGHLGRHEDAEYVWQHYRALYGTAEAVLVTHEYWHDEAP